MEKTKYQKPIPFKTQDNARYWDAADQHQLAIQHCCNCEKAIHPPGPACPKCGSTELNWVDYGNEITGTIYSYVVTYVPMLPGFQDDLPTIILQVAVDQVDGVQIIGNLINGSAKDVTIGKKVKMTWVDIDEERALPQWELA